MSPSPSDGGTMPVTPAKRKVETGSQEDHTPLFGKRLRQKTQVNVFVPLELERDVVAAIEAHGLGFQGNPERQLFSKDPMKSCALCGSLKHRCRWEYRRTGKGLRKCVGSTCYCCVRGAHTLKLPRGVTLLKSVTLLLRAVQLKSGEERQRLRQRGQDVCTCADCEASP